MTKEISDEKYRELQSSNHKQTCKFCPLIREDCRMDCMCFVEARLVNHMVFSGKTEPKIEKAYCGNAMFHQYRTEINGS